MHHVQASMRTLGVLIKVDGLPIDVTVMRRMFRAHASQGDGADRSPLEGAQAV